MRKTVLSPATDGHRGPFPTYGQYAFVIRNLLANNIPIQVQRIVIDPHALPAFLAFDENVNVVRTQFDDYTDPRGWKYFLNSCRAVVDGPLVTAQIRKFMRWIHSEQYAVEIKVISDGERSTPAFWRLSITGSLAEFVRVEKPVS